MDEVNWEKIEILSKDDLLKKFHWETENGGKWVKFEEMNEHKKVFFF